MQIKTIGSGSLGNAYFVSDGTTSILLEAGVKFSKVQQFLNFKTRQIKGLLLSHEHLDHAKYIEEHLRNGINVYATPGTKSALDIEHHRLFTVEYKTVFKIGSLTIMPFETQHDVAEPCGYLVKSDAGSKLLFATDTYYIKYKFPGITHMLLEVNHDYDYMMENVANGLLNQGLANRIMKSHLNLENAIKYLQSSDLNDLKEIHLIHLSNSNSKANEFKEKIQAVTGVPVKIAGR